MGLFDNIFGDSNGQVISALVDENDRLKIELEFKTEVISVIKAYLLHTLKIGDKTLQSMTDDELEQNYHWFKDIHRESDSYLTALISCVAAEIKNRRRDEIMDDNPALDN